MQFYFPLKSGQLVEIKRPYIFVRPEGASTRQIEGGFNGEAGPDLKKALLNAMSVVRMVWEEVNGPFKEFIEVNIDLGLPDGVAMPLISGRSAELALALALFYALDQRYGKASQPHFPFVCATGVFDGMVILPVDGVREKLRGAINRLHGGGLVLVPSKNFIELQKENDGQEDKSLSIQYVENIKEALAHMYGWTSETSHLLLSNVGNKNVHQKQAKSRNMRPTYIGAVLFLLGVLFFAVIKGNTLMDWDNRDVPSMHKPSENIQSYRGLIEKLERLRDAKGVGFRFKGIKAVTVSKRVDGSLQKGIQILVRGLTCKHKKTHPTDVTLYVEQPESADDELVLEDIVYTVAERLGEICNMEVQDDMGFD